MSPARVVLQAFPEIKLLRFCQLFKKPTACSQKSTLLFGEDTPISDACLIYIREIFGGQAELVNWG